MGINKFIPSFEEHLTESNKTWSNYHDYRSGKAPLQSAVLTHGAGDDVYDFIMRNIKRNMWQNARDTFKKVGMNKTKK